MKTSVSPRVPLLLAAWLCLGAAVADAQIFYIQRQGTGSAEVGQLRSIRPNGTGDRAIPLHFPDVALPAWSRNASRFAVTAKSPQRPGQISLDAFSINRVTGAFQNVTKFQDHITSEAYTYSFALYKAYSPDGKFMAVNSVFRSGGSKASETGTPALQIFATDGTGSVALVHVGPIRDNVHHDGEGVDWSPKANLIVAPVQYDAPLVGGGVGKAEATALVLAQPVTNGGSARLLTLPRGGHIDNGPFGEHIIWAEHDYAPRFSPDGNFVAYVRSYQAVSSVRLLPDPNIQSLHIINVNTGNNVRVKRFRAGQYITSLDWSPDGKRLVFDKGKQATTSEGAFLQGVDPNTDRLFIINRDGTGLRQLKGPRAGTPAWRPQTTNLAASTADAQTAGEEDAE